VRPVEFTVKKNTKVFLCLRIGKEIDGIAGISDLFATGLDMDFHRDTSSSPKLEVA
jgi:hypothetical protein